MKGGRRNGAGRPLGSTSRKAPRNVVKQIRWTKAEWAEVERKASADNLTSSEWIRKRCL
jgi:hypothetical protein